jgi:type IV secretory pathway TrbD component
MATTPELHPVYKSINRTLTIWGAERQLFFLAAILGAATFNLFGTLLGGVFMFIILYAFARWATATDPQILRIVLNSARLKANYDPAKYEPSVSRRGSFRD